MSAEPQAARLSVLHICPLPAFSGLESYALSMATGQKKLGHDVAFVALSGSPLADKCEDADIPVIEIEDNLPGKLKWITGMIRLFTSEHCPDLVHLHGTQFLDPMILPLFLSRLTRKNRVKVVLQTHIWISHSKKDPLHALSYKLIDEVWCSSGPAKAALARYLPIPESKLRIVNYGREVEKMQKGFYSRAEARRGLGLPEHATVVGTVARIDEGKGTRELLEGALLSMKKHPDLHLMLIGPPTSTDPKAIAFGERIMERIAQLPEDLRSRVHAPGAVPESYRFLKAFDLFALPTYMECFALSLLEAMLAEVPCLSTNTGGSPEVVREGETGWLFEPRSIDSLHQALERAIADRSKWATYGSRANARVRGEFDFEKLLPTTVDAYKAVLEKSQPNSSRQDRAVPPV